jgi:hypothetical protein
MEYGLADKKATQKVSNPFGRDSIEVSQDARLEDIHRQILSGKPLKGVSYEEFKKYSMKYDKQTADYEVSRLYKQALRGYEDILTKRDFYGEDFVLTDAVRLSAEYQAEGAKLRERCMAGEKLNGYERNVMCNADISAALDAENHRDVTNLTSRWEKLLDEFDLSAKELNSLTITIKGLDFSIQGIEDEEKRLAIEARFNQKSGGGAKTALYIWGHNVQKKPHDFFSGMFSMAEQFLKDFTNGKVALTDLSLDDKRNIIGLPQELEKYFKNIDTTDMNAGIDSDDPQEIMAYMDKKNSKYYVQTALTAIMRDGYETVKANMSEHKFMFENGRLVFS